MIWYTTASLAPLSDVAHRSVRVFFIHQRQDILILQMFGMGILCRPCDGIAVSVSHHHQTGIMDRLWKQHGLDLHMTIYGCIATGETAG